MLSKLNNAKKWLGFMLVISTVISFCLSQINNLQAYSKTTPTLTYFCKLDVKVATSYTNYAQLAVYQLLMKKLGVKIIFKHPPLTNANENFNLMIASRQLPDIIEWNWIDDYPGGPVQALKDKIIISLNQYLPKYAPNLKKYLEQHPDIRRLVITDEGIIYGFPFLKTGYNGKPYATTGPQVRKDWLKKLGLNPPETVDDWYIMLKKFVKSDPNGNGQRDEKGFSISGHDIRKFFNDTSFLVGAWGIKTDFFQVNGKVKFGPLEPQFKQFMATLQKWWKEGLINPDILSWDNKTFQANVISDKVGAYVATLGTDMGAFLRAGKDIIGVKYPVLKRGQQPELGPADSLFFKSSAAITTACKNIPLAMRVLDWGYGKEGFMALNYGIEGKSYIIKKGKVYFTDEILKHPNLTPPDALSRYARGAFSGPFVRDDMAMRQLRDFPVQQNEASDNWSNVKNEKILPPLTFTDEESRKVRNIMNIVNTYYDEMFVRLMIGKETNIEAFVKTLKRMGIEEAIKIYQAALERFKKRK